MAPKVGITWDAEADRKILLAILKDASVTANINWDDLAAEISTEAATCSVAALKKHLSRLRISVKNGQDSSSDGSDNPAPKTPATKGKAKGNGTAGSSAGPKSKGKGRKRKVADESDDDEGTPLTKRFKKVADKEEEPQIKAEANDEDEG
ncbi:hypothetical protein D6D25_03592 [Aureobasidium pullulans]|nr:hypothetical protein D6D25_03592 [Aureobasidium pullulans]